MRRNQTSRRCLFTRQPFKFCSCFKFSSFFPIFFRYKHCEAIQKSVQSKWILLEAWSAMPMPQWILPQRSYSDGSKISQCLIIFQIGRAIPDNLCYGQALCEIMRNLQSALIFSEQPTVNYLQTCDSEMKVYSVYYSRK